MRKLLRVSAAVLVTGASFAATAAPSVAATPAEAPPCPTPQLITVTNNGVTIRVSCASATIPTHVSTTTVG
jgi:hypothetical protein